MSGKIEISREMFDRMINALEDEGWYNLADEAAKAIAAPVVERQRNQCDGCQAGKPLEKGNRHRMGNGSYPDFMACTAKLYTSPPAPVEVVLPERMPHPERGYDYTADGWNACLDKVKELNQ